MQKFSYLAGQMGEISLTSARVWELARDPSDLMRRRLYSSAMSPVRWTKRRPLDGPIAAAEVAVSEGSDYHARLHSVGGPSGFDPVRRPRIRRDIEGLRAVAVALVVLYHAKLARVTGGYVGVDVFFVISGFLITRQLLGELAREGSFSLARFYARRIKRLLPASALVAVATLVGSLLWISPLRLGNIVRDVVATAFYVVNYRLAVQGTDYLASSGPPSPLQHYWSLAVEEQFYLLWPVLLSVLAWVWSRRAARGQRITPPAALLGIALTGIFVTSLGLSVWLTHRSAPWAYFSLPSRAWELALGALVAVGADRLARLPRFVAASASWLGLGLIACSAFLFTDFTAFPGIAAALPVGGAALVIGAGCAGPRFGAESMLRLPPMQLGGRLSYSWYLWHWPAIILGAAALGHPLRTKSMLAVVAASFVLAWVTYHLVENPIRSKEILSQVPRKGLALGVSLSASTALVAIVAIAVVPSARGSGRLATVPSLASSAQASRVSQIVGEGVSTQRVPSNLNPPLETVGGDRPAIDQCHIGIAATKSGPCVFGDSSASTTVVLFGDSHAGQWFAPLNDLAHARHWKLVVFVKSECPSVNVHAYSVPMKREYVECDKWRSSALDRIRSMRPRVVVLSSSVTFDAMGNFDPKTFEQSWLSGTTSIVQQIEATGAVVVWLGDTPRPRGSAPDCVATHLQDARACMNDVAIAQVDNQRRVQSAAAAAAAGATVIDPTPWICPGTKCPVVVGNLLVYRDNSHLSTAYVDWLEPLLAARLPLT
jgi:peptidoglycan/LPS O-acetylase OafA/YrhL